MNDLIIQPKFETLATQLNLKGEECYDEHTIAEALGIQFSDLRKITDRLQKANEIHGQDFICTVKAGFTTKEVESRLFNLDDTKLIVTQSGGKHAVAFCRYLIQRDKKATSFDTLLSDPDNAVKVFQELANQKKKAQELEARIPQLESERDHAIKTKGQISSNKAATSMVRLSNLVQYMRKRGIPIPAYAEIDSEEGVLERVRELEELLKKHDAALEAYRRKEDLQDEKNLTYIPTSKNGTGFNEVLKRWGYILTVGNNRDINKVIRCYLSNIGGEILWADSTFKGAPSKRCLWHPQFLDENKGRILNFLKNEGWLKKA
jgi:hypothetical protein